MIQLFTNYDEMSYPESCCNWELTGALLWEEKLKSLIENADDPLESLTVIQTEHRDRIDNVRSLNDQTIHYNSDGTENELWAITWTMIQAQGYYDGYYVSSIISDVSEGMSFETAFNRADETAGNWIEQLSSGEYGHLDKSTPVSTNIITPIAGSSNANWSCEINGCYSPSTAAVNVGDVVIFQIQMMFHIHLHQEFHPMM